jgi:hypothetical protein
MLRLLQPSLRYYVLTTKRVIALTQRETLDCPTAIILAISKATRLLLKHLTLNNNNYLNALEEFLFALKLCLTALNLHAIKSKQLSNISLTLIREDLRPSCARC